MIAALARPPVARLARGGRAWIGVGAWTALALAVAFTARAQRAAHGADHVLVETYGALVLPLVAYVVVGAVVASRSLRASTEALVALGAAPARAAFAAVAVGAVASAALGAGLGGIVALVAHGISDPPIWHDAALSAYAGALGGAAYAAWFSLGASFGRRGGGRALFLLADWVLGAAASGAGAAACPRGHLRNLLGGVPPMDLSQRASALALVALALACGLAAVRRARTSPSKRGPTERLQTTGYSRRENRAASSEASPVCPVSGCSL